MNAAQKSDFITRTRQAATKLMEALEEFDNLNRLYVNLDLGNVLVDGDFQGENAGIPKADLVSAIGSLGTINTTVINGNHDDVLYKVRS